MKFSITNRHRFKAPGKATNWEMAGLREGGHWRDTRWAFPWSSLSDAFHPTSQQEFLERRDRGDS